MTEHLKLKKRCKTCNKYIIYYPPLVLYAPKPTYCYECLVKRKKKQIKKSRERFKRIQKRKRLKRIRHKSTKTLKKKAWKLMSEYVRRRDRGICFTCRVKKHWKEQQAGHFIHLNSLDYDFMNIHCQCVRCNHYLGGDLGVYAVKLIKKYGLNKVEKLREKAIEIKRFTVEELETIIKDLQKKIEEL